MDDFKSQATTGAGLLITGICGCGLLAASITLVVYQGIFSYNNPDPEGAWTAAGLTKVYSTKALAEDAVQDANLGGDVVVEDMHAKFVTWFLWSFWLNFVPIGVGILVGVVRAISDSLGQCVNFLAGCGICAASLGLFISGIVWRFSKTGRTAAGEHLAEWPELDPATAASETDPTRVSPYGDPYQVSSGKFIKVLYLICMWSVISSCGCAVIGCCCTCICAAFASK